MIYHQTSLLSQPLFGLFPHWERDMGTGQITAVRDETSSKQTLKGTKVLTQI